VFLNRFPADAKLKVRFKGVKKATPSKAVDQGPLGGGGCKSVPTFTASATPPLKAYCVSCHGGGNPGATNSMNLTAIDTDATATCKNVLRKVNTANKAESTLLKVVQGGTPHPFSFQAGNPDLTTFRSGILAWANNE
jgi:hypothetical protein